MTYHRQIGYRQIHSAKYHHRHRKGSWQLSTEPILQCIYTGRWMARVPTKNPAKPMSGIGIFDTKEEAEAFLVEYNRRKAA